MLGEKYLTGYVDGESQYSKAEYWLEKAANSGDLNAQYLLGREYCGRPPSTRESCIRHSYNETFGINTQVGLNWLTKAAEAGHLTSQSLPGSLYAKGRSPSLEELAKVISLPFGRKKHIIIEYDKDGAIKWLTKAAEKGYSKAQFKLGELYLDNLNDKNKAEFWLIKAVETEESNNVTPAKLVHDYLSLAVLFSNTKKDFFWNSEITRIFFLNKSKSKAEFWFVKAAECDELEYDRPRFQYELAMHYLHGDYIQQDYRKAKHWFEKCLKLRDNYIEALFQLGILYADGLGLSHDRNTADAIFSSIQKMYSKEKNQTMSMGYGLQIFKNLAKRYKNGTGVPQNMDKALYWKNKEW